MSKAVEGSSKSALRAPHIKQEMAAEIIYSTEVIEQEEEEEVEEEVEEIVEIIEEIEEIEEIVEEQEEVEEEEEEEPAEVEAEEEEVVASQETEDSVEKYDEESQNDSAREDDPSIIPQNSRRVAKNSSRVRNARQNYENRKKIVNYDADEDWEEEEHEREQRIAESRRLRGKMNGKRSANDFSANTRSSEPSYKIAKTREYAENRNSENSVDPDDVDEEEEEEEEDENQHEIVKNNENNLVYTVLGSKKSNNSNARNKRDANSTQNQDNPSYLKMERLDEDSNPGEGTIYYEGDNLETVYVAQTVDETVEDEYQYGEETPEQDEQEWETANEATAEEQEDEESVQQDQIFLHEDENGQLYFKDDQGELQPVYLTADGNYAIAENSSDEQENQDSANIRQQPASPSSSTGDQNAKNFEEDNFIVPELETAASGSTATDPENEDNTVTISLIISEDENGQKRTQVIIPTTDNLKCELCAKSFKTPFQLLRHNRLKHAREEDITTRNFPCDLCPKRYSDQNTLARHRKTHIGDRPFGCLECGKSFPTSTALRRHLTQHNPQSRPLPCIYCGRRFLEKSALTKHEQSHLAGDQRTHTCDICHKTFLQAADLNLHKKNHDPDKKFDCEVCGREFNRLNNLQRHMMVHKQKQGQNQEILACDVCGITYKFMSSLTRHMVTSHMNPEKLRQQADEQRKKRENNYRRYLENRKMYETQNTGSSYVGSGKRGGSGSGGYRSNENDEEDTA